MDFDRQDVFEGAADARASLEERDTAAREADHVDVFAGAGDAHVALSKPI